jgi:hypothetical protein
MNLSQLISLAIICAPALPASLVGAEPQGLPPDAEKVVKEYNAQVVAIQKKAEAEIESIRRRVEQEILAAREECRKTLKVVQDTYTKAGKLDEAVAIRDRIASLPAGGEILPDPGTLSNYNNQIGKSFFFEVVGSHSGALFGDETYTSDSTLAKAAVHSGVLKEGQKGIVRVTILSGDRTHASTTKNGITSSGWSGWYASFKVESAYFPATDASAAKP